MNKQPGSQTLLAASMALMALLLTSTSAMAHPGHDHAANESMLMHVLFYGAIVAAVAVAVWFAYRQINKQSDK